MILFLTLLAVLFIGLKLAGTIAWAWYVVLIPTVLLILFMVFPTGRL